jgi:hypothetical protein
MWHICSVALLLFLPLQCFAQLLPTLASGTQLGYCVCCGGDDGALLSCKSCPAAIHPQCLPALAQMNSGWATLDGRTWLCGACSCKVSYKRLVCFLLGT